MRTAPDFIDSLKTAVEARSGFIAAKGVFRTAPIGSGEAHPERIIQIVRVRGSSDFYAIGDHETQGLIETYVVEGIILGVGRAPGGDEESAAKAARDAAHLLYMELDGALRDPSNRGLGGTRSHVLEADIDQGTWDTTGRSCVYTFNIHVKARV